MAKSKAHQAMRAAHAKAMASHKQTGQSLAELGQLLQASQGQQEPEPQQQQMPAMSPGVSPLGGQAR